MNIRNGKQALAAIALATLATLPAAGVRAEDMAAEIRFLKERLRQLEAKVNDQARKQKEVQAEVRHAAAQPGIVCKDGPCPPPPPPVFVTFKNGLKVESFDHDFSFKIGGRIFVDGGFSSQPEGGFASHASIRRARLEVEGKAFKYWYYKMQYDFVGAGNGLTIGGIRDAWLALRYPVPILAALTPEPVTFQAGHQYEPMGLEQINSSKYITFIERSNPTNAFTPERHIGFRVGAGDKAWSVNGGVYTNRLEDKAVGPVAPGFSLATLKPGSPVSVPGGAQFWDLASRVTYAPIQSEDTLAHLGGSVRYHRPNSATALSDADVLAIGSTIKTEANILGENLLGTPDLSCAPGVFSTTGTPLVTVTGNLVQRSCAKNVLTFGAEYAGAYGPLSVQAEYLHRHDERDATTILLLGAPGGTSLDFSGYYVYGSWFLTGESRAAAYNNYAKDFNAPGTFGQMPIKHPWSAGGWGAWEFAARFSEINLNDGGLVPFTNLGVIGLKKPATLIALSNTGIIGGREGDVTVGLNWYPERGFRVMANWVKVTHLTAPFDRPFLNGAHPSIFVMRAQVDW